MKNDSKENKKMAIDEMIEHNDINLLINTLGSKVKSTIERIFIDNKVKYSDNEIKKIEHYVYYLLERNNYQRLKNINKEDFENKLNRFVKRISTEKIVIDAAIKNDDMLPLIKLYGSLIKSTIVGIFIIKRIAFSEKDIEDIEQEVYINIFKNDYRRLKKFDTDIGSLHNWLKLIANQATNAEIRKKKDAFNPYHKNRRYSIDTKLAKEIEEIFCEEGRFDAREQFELIFEAVENLSPLKQTIFKLRYYDGVHESVIAQLMDKSIPSITGHLSRIKQSLKDYIEIKLNE